MTGGTSPIYRMNQYFSILFVLDLEMFEVELLNHPPQGSIKRADLATPCRPIQIRPCSVMFGLNFKGDFFHVWTDCTVAGVMDTRQILP